MSSQICSRYIGCHYIAYLAWCSLCVKKSYTHKVTQSYTFVCERMYFKIYTVKHKISSFEVRKSEKGWLFSLENYCMFIKTMFVVLVLSTVLYKITKSPKEIRITFIMFWILVIAFVENGCWEFQSFIAKFMVIN